MSHLKKTKIITTIGPATDSKEKIEELYNNGSNIIRINYSHSNYDYFKKLIGHVIQLNSEGKTNLALLTDTKGPEIRTKAIDNKIKLSKGELFVFTTISNETNITNTDNKKVLVCDYEYIVSDLDVGHIIDVDSGLLKVMVIEKKSGELICEALNDHSIGSKRHVNLPGIKIHLPGITDSDKEDIKFAVEQGTDFIALSFVRNKANILELREYLKEIGAPEGIEIISKIENQEALDNLDEIIDESDGIMIARGDLGAEVPFETLPIIQKMIGDKCKEAGKYFIVATQILESMHDNPIPTRAEVTDVFNAVMQKADCTMLSGETAAGNYPIEAVSTMKNVIKYSETQVKSKKHKLFTKDLGKNEDKKIVIRNAIITAENLESKALIVFSKSGHTAKLIAALRSSLPVFAFTYSKELSKKSNILYGIKSFVIEEKSNKENLENAIEILKEKGLLETGNEIVTVNGMYIGDDRVPTIQVKRIK